MKKIVFVQLYGLILLFTLNSINLYKYDIHTISSLNNIVFFSDPLIQKNWIEADGIKGSLILSWKDGISGIGGAFCKIIIYTPFPGGGKYEISLNWVIESNSSMIKGLWSVVKNGTKIVEYQTGCLAQLDRIIGDLISLKIGGMMFKTKISYVCNFCSEYPEIIGQIKNNDIGINDAEVMLKQKDREESDILPTYNNGDYKFLAVNPDMIDFVNIHFTNDQMTASVSGNIYLLRMPWKFAKVTFFLNTDLIYTALTDEDGFFSYVFPADMLSLIDVIDILIQP